MHAPTNSYACPERSDQAFRQQKCVAEACVPSNTVVNDDCDDDESPPARIAFAVDRSSRITKSISGPTKRPTALRSVDARAGFASSLVHRRLRRTPHCFSSHLAHTRCSFCPTLILDTDW